MHVQHGASICEVMLCVHPTDSQRDAEEVHVAFMYVLCADWNEFTRKTNILTAMNLFSGCRTASWMTTDTRKPSWRQCTIQTLRMHPGGHHNDSNRDAEQLFHTKQNVALDEDGVF